MRTDLNVRRGAGAWRGLAPLVCLLAMGAAAEPAPLFAPDAAATLDEAGCRLFVAGQPPQAGDAGILRQILAPDGRSDGWRAPANATGMVHHVIAWRAPRAIGSVLAQEAEQIAVLRAGAASPPDANDERQWESLTLLGRGASGLRVAAAEAVRQSTAIRITRRASARSSLDFVRITPARLNNTARDGFGHAESEYTVHPDMSPPYTLSMAGLLAGRGRWQNTGPDKNEFTPRAPVSDVAPSWLILSWTEPRMVTALWLEGNAASIQLSTYQGPDGVHPLAGTSREWKRIREVRREGPGGSLLLLDAPVTTRALRLEIARITPIDGSDRIVRLEALLALSDLGAAPLPVAVDTPPVLPPVTVPVAVAATGTVSVVIDAPDGRRLRNLTARQAVTPGTAQIPWDLKDDAGLFQGVGTYRWTALSVPTLGLKYQMTPYPNVEMHSDNTPWLNGAAGPGGWLADHSAPRAVCAVGKQLFFGSPCAESGVALVGCDLEGRKQWGHHNFMAWTGPSYLASDGQQLFVGAPSTADMVWSIPLEGGRNAVHIQAAATADRLRGMRGLAATADRLYLSVAAAGTDIFDPAATPADIDYDKTVPFLRPVPKPDRGNWDKRLDLARLFRLTGTPPGQNGGLTYIETTDMPASRQHMVLAFKRPVPLGSLALPLPGGENFLRLAVLKPEASWPPDPERAEDWNEFYHGKQAGWTVMPLPPDVRTRALRITVDRAEDELDDLLDAPAATDALAASGQRAATSRHAPWRGRLEGMALLRHRLGALPVKPAVRVNSGQVDSRGTWDAMRDRPLTEDDPAIYTMIWPEPQTVRGLAIMEIDGKRTEIDVYTGPATGEIDITDDRLWRRVARYEQRLRYYYGPDPDCNVEARYMDGYVDFGQDVVTRAIRLRVCEQWLVREQGRAGCVGVRVDRGGRTIDATRCYVYGIAAVRRMDAENAVDALRTDRIEVYDGTGKAVTEWPLHRPGSLAVDPRGSTLYAVSGTNVAALDTATGKSRLLALDAHRPGALACDAAGRLYVFDHDPARLQVRVYDPLTGAMLHTVGTPGGYRAGPWDPTRLTSGSHVAVALAVDANERLWIVENDHIAKRISRWTLAGQFEKELLGNPRYGGGGDGCLDPWNKRRLYYEDGGATLVFDLDWKTGRTSLAGIAGLGKHGGGVLPVRRDGHRYLVTRPLFGRQACGRVFLLTNDVARLVAAVGAADAFPELRNRAVLSKLGGKALDAFDFLWSDLNGDSLAQAEEVVLLPADGRGIGAFDRELGVYADHSRYAVKVVRPDGVPVYEAQALQGGLAGKGGAFRLPDGRTVAMGPGLGGHAGFDTEQRRLWSWRTEGFGVHAYYAAGPYIPQQVVAEFDIVGAETVEAGGIGTFYATSSNTGTWHLWSGDGILFGRLFQDLRQPGREGWSMRSHARGLELNGVTLSQEHFSGYLCRVFGEDTYYAVAGHNHISVVAIEGLERVQRQTGTITVDGETVRKGMDWLAGEARRSLYKRAPVLRCYRATQAVLADGQLEEWPATPEAVAGENDRLAFRLSYDDTNLYAAWEVQECGPFANGGNDWRRLFKTGAAVDLQLGTDPTADPTRQDPAAGDLRLLIAPFEGKPAAVLYRPIDATAPEDAGWETRTGVFRSKFDRVQLLERARIAVGPAAEGRTGYVVEAAVPLADLGLTIGPETRVRCDWGVQEVGPDGNVVMQRLYWANQSARIISDEAAESILYPGLWGDLLFLGRRPEALEKQMQSLEGGKSKLSGGTQRLLDDILEED